MWYLSIFVWGWLLIFEIRVLLISLFAPKLASRIFAEEQKEKKPFDTGKLNCCTRLFIPSYSLITCLDILYLIDIKKNPGNYMPLSITTPGLKKYSEVELLPLSNSKSKGKRNSRQKTADEVEKSEKAQFKTNEVVSPKKTAIIVSAE